MIAIDGLAALVVLVGLSMIVAGLAIMWDHLVYTLANRSERRAALRRAARHRHPAGKAGNR